MTAPLLAAASAALAVLAAHDGLAALDGRRVSAALDRSLAALRVAGREGRDPSAAERRRLGLLAALVLLAGGWLVAGPVVGAMCAVGGPWAAVAAIRARRRRHRTALVAGAPVVARALADALAGGNSVHGAVVEAARCGGVPGAGGVALARAAQALAVGESVEEALEALALRAESREYDTIVAAIALQHRAGGDLARLLREIAASLEEAARLDADARTATAQARFTGLLVAGLPAGTAVLAEMARPGYLAGLAASPLTAWLAGAAALMQVAALLAIRRLGRLR